jgi:hypothetical protein
VKAMRVKPVTRPIGTLRRSSTGGKPLRSAPFAPALADEQRVEAVCFATALNQTGPPYRRREATPGVLRTAAVASRGSPQRSQCVMTHLDVNRLIRSTRR